MNEINEAGSAFAPLIQSADDIDDDQYVPDWTEDSQLDPTGENPEGENTDPPGGNYLANESYWVLLNSWRERNIQKFIDSKFGSAVNAAIDGVKIFKATAVSREMQG